MSWDLICWQIVILCDVVAAGASPVPVTLVAAAKRSNWANDLTLSLDDPFGLIQVQHDILLRVSRHRHPDRA